MRIGIWNVKGSPDYSSRVSAVPNAANIDLMELTETWDMVKNPFLPAGREEVAAVAPRKGKSRRSALGVRLRWKMSLKIRIRATRVTSSCQAVAISVDGILIVTP